MCISPKNCTVMLIDGLFDLRTDSFLLTYDWETKQGCKEHEQKGFAPIHHKCHSVFPIRMWGRTYLGPRRARAEAPELCLRLGKHVNEMYTLGAVLTTVISASTIRSAFPCISLHSRVLSAEWKVKNGGIANVNATFHRSADH
jgi:hypothetical protein